MMIIILTITMPKKINNFMLLVFVYDHTSLNYQFIDIVVCFQLLFLNKLLSVLYLEIFCLTGLFKNSLKDQNFD